MAKRHSIPIANKVSVTDVRFRPAVEVVVVVPSRMVSLWWGDGQEDPVVMGLPGTCGGGVRQQSHRGCRRHRAIGRVWLALSDVEDGRW